MAGLVTRGNVEAEQAAAAEKAAQEERKKADDASSARQVCSLWMCRSQWP